MIKNLTTKNLNEISGGFECSCDPAAANKMPTVQIDPPLGLGILAFRECFARCCVALLFEYKFFYFGQVGRAILISCSENFKKPQPNFPIF